MNNSKISIIVAAAGKNRVIGTKGGMAWYIPEELKRFKEITMGHPIIMGRKTHESIGKVLPGRANIVITREPNYLAEGCIVVNSLDEAIKVAVNLSTRHPELVSGSQKEMPKQVRHDEDDEIFVIGGGQIYQEAINLADKLYLTYVDKEINGDVFFPDYSEFKKVISESDWQEHEGIRYKFFELERYDNYKV